PEDYRQFLLQHNGGKPEPDTIDFMEHSTPNSSDITYIYGIHSGEYWARLDWHMNTYEGRIIDEGLSIAGDSVGNQYVLVIRGHKKGHIFFWNHEEETDTPSFDNMSHIAKSFTEFIEKLYEYVKPNETEAERIVRENDLEALRRLLDSGYDVETLDEYNRTLIENAAIHNCVRMIKILFDRGAELRNALSFARKNYDFFPEHKASVELLEQLEKLRSGKSN
ncbi:MAG TPA: SMI1/KNR4 family protein, partial [Aggregatilineaceae bacterium]|nr:SMI1/KNR4 family protein [Aggregatilineaceae bacterium]